MTLRGMTGKHHSIKSRLKMSQAHKGKPLLCLRGRQSPFKGKHHTLTARLKISKALKGKSKSIEHRKKISMKRNCFLNAIRIAHRKQTSNFHKFLIPILTSIGYFSEYDIGKYMVDFALPRNKIVIEIDGPHHEHPKTRKNDFIRDHYLRQKGWKIIRIKEIRS